MNDKKNNMRKHTIIIIITIIDMKAETTLEGQDLIQEEEDIVQVKVLKNIMKESIGRIDMRQKENRNMIAKQENEQILLQFYYNKTKKEFQQKIILTNLKHKYMKKNSKSRKKNSSNKPKQ
ncbi:unnamed protein product [Paramecium sonneborni]|uniref:Uncharacterized protein n=1 Tax=Paramecium sonneborni TaxID=65129 RepID=A0A8S1LVZ7_9CILI|nr:unnamed protein product [Paramecium sonneborni]